MRLEVILSGFTPDNDCLIRVEVEQNGIGHALRNGKPAVDLHPGLLGARSRQRDLLGAAGQDKVIVERRIRGIGRQNQADLIIASRRAPEWYREAAEEMKLQNVHIPALGEIAPSTDPHRHRPHFPYRPAPPTPWLS